MSQNILVLKYTTPKAKRLGNKGTQAPFHALEGIAPAEGAFIRAVSLCACASATRQQPLSKTQIQTFKEQISLGYLRYHLNTRKAECHRAGDWSCDDAICWNSLN